MRGIKTNELGVLDRIVSELQWKLSEICRGLHKGPGKLAEKKTDLAIMASGLNTSSGKVRRGKMRRYKEEQNGF